MSYEIEGPRVMWRGRRDHLGLPIVVSYFTDQFYMREAFELVRSCQLFDLDYDVDQVPDLKSWSNNTSYKPKFLLEKHREHPNRPLLWLDADARVRKLPTFPKCGLSFHHFQKHPLSGTVYLGADPLRELFLKAWVHQVATHPTENDQVCMGLALETMPKEFSFIELPADFCWIFDFDGSQPVTTLTVNYKPVIEHMQASRWAKKLAKVRR